MGRYRRSPIRAETRHSPTLPRATVHSVLITRLHPNASRLAASIIDAEGTYPGEGKINENEAVHDRQFTLIQDG
jgi:hypothetical protein